MYMQNTEKTLIRNLQGSKTKRIPIWFMRQAGRYLPEYKEIRKGVTSFLELCYNTDLATEVTLQPIRRFDLDAAIVFSDILVVPHAMGMKVEFVENEGPKLKKIEQLEDVNSLEIENIEKLATYETLKKVASSLPKHISLIGFTGAPWTLACYAIEGKSSKDFANIRKLAYDGNEILEKLIEKFVQANIIYLKNQIKSGAEVVQIFDSWSGILSDELFIKFCIEPTKKIVEGIRTDYPDIPVIGFPKGSPFSYYDYAIETGINAISVDSNIPLEFLKPITQAGKIIQGNLDPAIVMTENQAIIEKEVRKIINYFDQKPFVFNLGHGMLQYAKASNVEKIIEVIRAYEK
jgi:uroporphyrinogen decarboxylase